MVAVRRAGADDGQRGEGAVSAARGRRGAAACAPAGPVPRLANGKPDLSGHWANPYTPNMALRAVDPTTRQPLKFARQGEALPDAMAPASGSQPRAPSTCRYTEWGLKKWKDYDPVGKGDYAGNCLPFGMSRNINSPHGVQILHHPDALAFLFEQNTWHHWVPTTASFKWPADLPETWNGIVDGPLGRRHAGDRNRGFQRLHQARHRGHPHSKELKLTNTFLRTRLATRLTHTVTVHDPKTYTQDWMNVRTWRIKPANDVLMEYSCEENNLQQHRRRRRSRCGSRTGRRLATGKEDGHEMTTVTEPVLVALALAAAPRGRTTRSPPSSTRTKPITFTGKVTKVEWMNPHIYTHVEVKDPDGKMVVYRVEGGPPNALFRAGLAQGHAQARRHRHRQRDARQDPDVDEHRRRHDHDRRRQARVRGRRRWRRPSRQPVRVPASCLARPRTGLVAGPWADVT